MKHTMKRALALVLALVMIIGMAPAMTLHAHAATTITLDDTTIGVSGGDASNKNGAASWNGSGKSVSGSVKGYVSLVIFDKQVNSKLTITNNRAGTAVLKFDYNFVAATGSDYVKFGSGSNLNGSQTGSYSVELAAGASLVIQHAATGNATSTLTLTDIQLIEDKTVTSTFLPGENGSYTVDGAEITAATELSKSAAEGYVLVATPAEGYQFVSWYNETTGKYLVSAASYTLALEEAATIRPVFAPVGDAVFSVGGIKYETLAKADAAASAGTNLIVLENNGTLAAGDYTISSGNTLLIPFDSNNTCYNTKDGVSTAIIGGGTLGLVDAQSAYAAPTAFRTLTMASGANLTVNGNLNVGGKHHAGGSADSTGNSMAGSPSGPVGMINMASDSTITVSKTGKLY